MTTFSRIEMAFEIYKSLIVGGVFYCSGSDPDKRRAERSFEIVDAFIKEAKKIEDNAL